MSVVMLLTSLWKGALGNSIVVYFWYLLISLKATVPGLHLNCLFSLTPPSAGAVFFLFPDALEAFEPVAWLLLVEIFPFFPAIFCLGILFSVYFLKYLNLNYS